MRRVLKIAVFGIMASMILAGNAVAAEATAEVFLNSAYVWRGINLNDEPVVQPSITVGTDWGLTFNTWANMNLTDNLGSDLKRDFDEVDLTVAYAIPIEGVNVEIGIVEYLFPNTEASGSREVYLTAGLDAIVSPSVSVYYDFDEIDGFYAAFSLAYGFDLMDNISAELAASIGMANSDYNEAYFDVDDAAFADGNATLTLTYAATESLELSIYGQYSRFLDSEIRDSAQEIYFNDDDTLAGGISASYTF